MKKVITIVALYLIGMTAYAQFGKPEQFFSFEGFYAPSHYLYTGTEPNVDTDEPFKQIGLGITNYDPLSDKVNLFLNWGVDLIFSDYEWKSAPYDFMGRQKTTEISYLYFSWTVRGDVGYLIEIPSTSIAFYPYAGVFARFHIGGNCYVKAPTYDPEDNVIYDKTTKTSLFTKSESNPEPFNRFEFGANIGANAFLGKFMLGLNYGKAFTELTKDTRVSELRLLVGMRF